MNPQINQLRASNQSLRKKTLFNHQDFSKQIIHLQDKDQTDYVMKRSYNTPHKFVKGNYKKSGEFQLSPLENHHSPPSKISLTPKLNQTKKKNELLYSRNRNQNLMNVNMNNEFHNLNRFKSINLYNETKNYEIKNIESIHPETKTRFERVKDQSISERVNLKKFSLEDFEIGSKLGKGKYGNVYLAREVNTNFIVALKILSKNVIRELRAQKQVG